MTSSLQTWRRSPISEHGARLLMSRAAVIAITILAIAPACFQPHYDRVMCNSEGECPGGLTCVDNVCERNTNDAMPPGDDASPPGDDATLPQARSCAGLGATCGLNHKDSCCNSPPVMGGTYYRSYDRVNDHPEWNMNFPATVSSFRLDRYEVTVGRFRAFVNAGMGTQANPPAPGTGAHTRISGSGWNASWNTALKPDTTALVGKLNSNTYCDGAYRTWTNTPGPNENRPMTCITWFEAMAFCIWDGGYLPTETEWNYAAAGGDEQRAYPWSNPAQNVTLDMSHASYKDGPGNCTGDGMTGCTLADLVEVGTKPQGDGRWGQSDLTGNVWEWTLDEFADTYASVCVDCANLATDITSDRVFRGSSFINSNKAPLRVASRGRYPPEGGIDIGVRCARSP